MVLIMPASIHEVILYVLHVRQYIKCTADKPTARRKLPWHAAFIPNPFFILLDHRLCIVKIVYVYTYLTA